jgi:hypothetical protein
MGVSVEKFSPNRMFCVLVHIDIVGGVSLVRRYVFSDALKVRAMMSFTVGGSGSAVKLLQPSIILQPRCLHIVTGKQLCWSTERILKVFNADFEKRAKLCMA